MVLGIGASLQQESLLRIEYQDGEGSMQLAFAMRIDLAGASEGAVSVVDQDDLLAGVALRCALQVVSRKRRYDSGTHA
jgi:hypothetical protein